MVQVLCLNISGVEEEQYRRLCDRASAGRRQRAEGYRHFRDRVRCVAGEALLRHALGTGEFTLAVGEYGKPYVPERLEVHVNLSHSGDWVVLAWGPLEVGVDVQQMKPKPDRKSFACRWFTEQEQAYVFREAQGEQERFYEIWTGKESWLKYLGTGIRTSLNAVDVLALPPENRCCRMLGEKHFLTLYCEDPEISFREVTVEQVL